MSAPTDVKVTFTGDTSQLTAATKTANAAIASTGTAAAAADAKIKTLAADTDRFSARLEDATDKVGKFGAGTGKAAAFLSVLSPGLADAARNAGDLADGGELVLQTLKAVGATASTVASVIGVVAVALAAAATAYAVLGNATSTAENIQRASAVAMLESEESANKLADALNRVTEAQRQTSKVYGDNSIKIGLLSGALEQYEVDAMSAAQTVRDGTAAEREALREALRVTNERLAAADKVAKSESAMAEERALAIKEQGKWGAASRQLQADLNNLNETADAQAGIVSALIIEKGKQEAADKAAASAAKRNADAQRAAADDVRAADEAAAAAAAARAAGEQRLQEFIKARAAAEQEYAAGVAALRQMESEANADRLTEIEAIDAARAQQMSDLNAMLTEQLAAAEGNELRQAEIEQAGRDARLAIEQRYQRDKGEIVAEGNAAVADANAAAQADAAATQAATQDAQIALAQAGAQSLVDITSAIYGGMTDAGLKKGLKAAFAASKAAALAQAGINTALAFSNALAAPLPPPLPQIAAAAALVSGLAAAAGIAAQQPPSFRSGYMPDQQLAMIEPGSEIVAPASAVQNLGGMERAREAFAGVSGGAPQVTRFTMGHREFSALTQGSALRPGPLRDLTVRPGAGRTNPHSRGSNG